MSCPKSKGPVGKEQLIKAYEIVWAVQYDEFVYQSVVLNSVLKACLALSKSIDVCLHLFELSEMCSDTE